MSGMMTGECQLAGILFLECLTLGMLLWNAAVGIHNCGNTGCLAYLAHRMDRWNTATGMLVCGMLRSWNELSE